MDNFKYEDFTQQDLKHLGLLAERIGQDAEWYGARLVVEVWARDDSGAVAFVEKHPDDGHPLVRFTRTASGE